MTMLMAGAGCAPIADWIDELEELGFVDGETMVSYESLHELIEKLDYYTENPGALREIGRRAGRLVLAQHTWDHRAHQLDELLSNYLGLCNA